MKRYLFLLAIPLLSAFANAQPRFARLFGEHAVLQRQKPIPVWGWASPKEAVTVSLANQKLSTVTDESGKWIVKFAAMEAGGPFVVEAQSQTGKAEIKDIWIGEVWICSGQSNMEWKVNQADNFMNERRTANYPEIRHFYVQHEVELSTQRDLKSGDWKICSPETVGDFTAVGFFFARELYQQLHIPIGLIHSSWGGSQIEGWISKEGMETNNELRSYAQHLPSNWQEADAFHDKNVRKKLFGRDYTPTLEDEKKYTQPNYNFTNWLKADSPIGQWDWKGIWAFRGKGFMARNIEVPNELVAQTTQLSLGIQDSPNEIYINGKLVQSGIIKGVRKVSIPPNTWHSGINQLVIKFSNMVEFSWFGLGLQGTAEDLYLGFGNEKISIASTWYLMPSFAEPHEYAHSSNNIGTSIYNAMIAPLVPYSIRGTLWYQGETNASRAFQYRQSFPLLINDWRKKWNDEFSFYFVQLSSYGANQNSNEGSNWAELREAQTQTLALPKTGMAVTIDVGNQFDIHPTNKQDVGHRLALNALRFDYGKSLDYSSPLYQSVRFDATKATLTFKHIAKGLVIKDKYQYLKGFEIAGEDHKFYYAKAEIVGDKVVVYHPKKTKPVAVRYAWSDAPVDANLFNSEGLPTSPFRTDSWKCKTEGVKFE
ncbi:MAG: sialate O-acetylesterase [Spirosomataceae bacterium]